MREEKRWCVNDSHSFRSNKFYLKRPLTVWVSSIVRAKTACVVLNCWTNTVVLAWVCTGFAKHVCILCIGEHRTRIRVRAFSFSFDGLALNISVSMDFFWTPTGIEFFSFEALLCAFQMKLIDNWNWQFDELIAWFLHDFVLVSFHTFLFFTFLFGILLADMTIRNWLYVRENLRKHMETHFDMNVCCVYVTIRYDEICVRLERRNDSLIKWRGNSSTYIEKNKRHTWKRERENKMDKAKWDQRDRKRAHAICSLLFEMCHR